MKHKDMEATNSILLMAGYFVSFLYFPAVQLINKLLNCEIDSVIRGKRKLIFDSSHKNVCKIN